MAEAKKSEGEKFEREYVIPLRNKWKRVPRYKRANKAVKAIKEFLVRHMKIRDRDLNKIKIDRYLNEEVWFRGIKNPPSKIKVKAVKDGENVKVELLELPEKLKFKKLREEKREKTAVEKAKPKSVLPAATTAPSTTPGAVSEAKTKKKEEESEEKKEEKIEEAKEKKSAVVEAGAKIEKEMAKQAKHQTKQSKQPKRQQRKALVK